MHLNYHFLKRLVPELELALQGAHLVECFSQEKDELIIGFSRPQKEDFYIRAALTSTFSCLSFPKDFKRSRRNSVDLFQELQGREVEKVRLFLNERAFSINFGAYVLLFKLHGNRSNLVLFHQGEILSLFKKQLKGDSQLSIDKLDRHLDRSQELYLNEPDYKRFYPTFGKLPAKYLQEHGFDRLDSMSQWQSLQELEKALEQDPIYLGRLDHKPVLSLLPFDELQPFEGTSLEASNAFFREYTGSWYLEREKQQAETSLLKKINQTENYISKSETKLQKLQNETQPGQIGDIIMANLHQIPERLKQVTLFNFYDNNQLTIKLNPELSPQKNAEQYYRKGKNRKIEVEKTEANILEKYELLEELKATENELKTIESLKKLRQLTKTKQLEQATGSNQKPNVPYKAFDTAGYQIWVGKSAKANDELSLKHAYKEDLWLHAKDVPGSHVLIKHQAGKNTPRSVIERAAELAAWYSKRKTDSLVPVIVTPAKYIRKRKGSPAGQVVVSREEVVLVTPKGPE